MIALLHHSTGNCIWKGGVPEWFEKYNAENGTSYEIIEQVFPKQEPYGWKNYPYDYWNIWVDHAGPEPYMEEPTLEMLTQKYELISWKHCYPVCKVQEDTGNPDVRSEEKRLENYKLQYEALKEKMHQFPDTRFIIWTGAALVEPSTSEDEGQRARAFFEWTKSEWDEPGDNIFLWDLYELETEGGLFLKPEHAPEPTNSHPSDAFSQMAAPYFCQRVVDILEGRGDSGSLTGK
ncbi:MAG: hypothetical protein HOC74_37780 [Gemmatimonadetes bacterium]|nr:hypothetical protein [Gemmatimonadota bacterium]